MQDFIEIVRHQSRLRNALKSFSMEQLVAVKGKIEVIIAERYEQLREQEKLEREHREKIKKYKALLAEDGIDPHDLVDSGHDRKTVRNKMPPKYEIYDDNGDRITWSGLGRKPNILLKRLEKGEELESFLIDKQ